MTMPRLALPLALLLPPLTFIPALGQDTIGLLLKQPGASPGYTLFGNYASDRSYLIDINGELVHTWDNPGFSFCSGYLLENGNFIQMVNVGNPSLYAPGGLVREVDWDGNVVWEFTYSGATVQAHHDVEVLPSGNVLILAQEVKTRDEAIAAGRNPVTSPDRLLPEHVIEVQPTPGGGGVIVWEWHAWDHLVQDLDPTKPSYAPIALHPELIDINYAGSCCGGGDFMHANSVAYNEDLDQVLISVLSFSEVWVIDHGTTTAEAAGHVGGARGRGGDLLYRWGNPLAYDAAAGTRNNYTQHNAHWIESGLPGGGNILFYNNGTGRPGGAASSADEITTPVDVAGNYPLLTPGEAYGPDSLTWTFSSTPPGSLYSGPMSGVQRLPNGNTLICESVPGAIWEVDPSGTVVWKYVSPVNDVGAMRQGDPPVGNSVWRAPRYAPDYPAFAGRSLTPMGPIELSPTAAVAGLRSPSLDLAQNVPNPVRSGTLIRYALERPTRAALEVYDAAGRLVRLLEDGDRGAGTHWASWDRRDAAGALVAGGVYFYRLGAEDRSSSRKMVVLP